MNTDSLAQCSSYFSSVFGSIWKRSSKNYKIPKEKETIAWWFDLIREKEKIAISEFSKFLILAYTQNGKLGNLGKFSFTSSFYRFRCINDWKD